MKKCKVGSLKVKLLKDRREVGKVGAKDAADTIVRVIAEKGECNIIFASAPSQNEMLDELTKDTRIDWSKIRAFNMDEYVGLPLDHPEGFGNYLKRKIYHKVKPGMVEVFNTQAEDPEAECERYAALLQKYPADIEFFGIGETCHLAFNDPPVAEFYDHKWVKVVDLDERTIAQEVHDGCFASEDEVPRRAYTITIPTVMRVPQLFGMVPGPTKADAVYHALTAEICKEYPASILRIHPNATLYIDEESAVKLDASMFEA